MSRLSSGAPHAGTNFATDALLDAMARFDSNAPGVNRLEPMEQTQQERFKRVTPRLMQASRALAEPTNQV